MLTCSNEDVTLDASASSGATTLDYEWFNASNTSLGTTATLDVMSSGTYTLVVTNPANGCTAETTVDVDQNVDLPLPDAQVSGELTCTVLDATLDASNSTAIGSLSYEWQNAGGTSLGSSSTISVSDAGTYTLIITDDDNGCTAQTTVDVDENIADPTPDAMALGQLTCQQMMTTLDAAASTGIGTLDYEWFDPANGSLGSGSTAVSYTHLTLPTILLV